jgi:hypothetical protein
MPSHLSRARFAELIAAAALIAPGASLADEATLTNLSALKAHRAKIARVRLYSVAGDITTMIPIAPGALERFPGVKKRVHADRRTIDALIDALVRAKPAPDEGRPLDARYGAIFEDGSGMRRFAAYTNFGASRGVLATQSVAFDNPFPLSRALDRALE